MIFCLWVCVPLTNRQTLRRSILMLFGQRFMMGTYSSAWGVHTQMLNWRGQQFQPIFPGMHALICYARLSQMSRHSVTSNINTVYKASCRTPPHCHEILASNSFMPCIALYADHGQRAVLRRSLWNDHHWRPHGHDLSSRSRHHIPCTMARWENGGRTDQSWSGVGGCAHGQYDAVFRWLLYPNTPTVAINHDVSVIVQVTRTRAMCVSCVECYVIKKLRET